MGVLASATLLLQTSNYSGSGDWLDESGNGHDFTLVNTPGWDGTKFTLNGTNEYFSLADHADFDIALTQDFTVMVRASQANAPSGHETLFAKKANAFNAGIGWTLNVRNSDRGVWFRVADGAAGPSDQLNNSVTDGTVFVGAGVRNTSDDDVEVFVDGTGTGSPTTDDTTGTSENALAVTIATISAADGFFWDGDIYAVAFWREALSDADVATATDEISGISAALTGTAITGGVLESEIVTGGETIIVTLTGDTWVATMGDDNAITDAFIAGIDSAQSEAAGWDAEVKGNMVFGDVARTSDTVVTITLAAEAAYAVTANETITVTIPATALTAGVGAHALATFDVTNETPAGGTAKDVMLMGVG